MASPPKSLTASKFSVDFVVAPKSRSPDRTLRTRARFLKLCELRTGVGCYSRVLILSYRTPFQCLARYQRSLNASILKREWTEVDDDKLRAAVETFRAGNWQLVASTLEGRTGTQCSN
ncbi:hypothetical protein RHMOL_Rhmol01G0036400 [Rhododendron molle]|uniref:Uncharacterized protein n=2 Tax=Rhododendron molle TaxID=49168 RepID=A0ACC0PZ80_RHOML|nr:hypothetical protein RHMOL_Rhmol04G0332700 [Rhododendron molle]KAI8570471.1 hypothetical protein RHMOL_Rhmol01G0036400 [Rhododendron molle]